MKSKLHILKPFFYRYKIYIGIVLFLALLYALYIYEIEILKSIANISKDFKALLILPITIIAYKLAVISITNLVKRFAINKGTALIKKLLFHSQLDEMIAINIHIYNEMLKSWSVWQKLASFVPPVIFVGIGAMYNWAFFLLKFVSAKFWTGILAGILTFFQAIPLFISFVWVWIWLWLEKKLPWLTKFYIWIYTKIRTFFNPIWKNFLAPFGIMLLDIIIWIDVLILLPISLIMNRFELRMIKSLRCNILKKRGATYYRRVMKLAQNYNDNQRRQRVAKKHKRKKIILDAQRKLNKKIAHIYELQNT